ncbi:O-antigen ligase family protein [Paraliomyxa miuraensis]|uniref:O-antigen ligase family protein n=1 Tax=Paraliomyxa miuraensis TaxID=376150 RepID=UPI00225253EC|nr:O-antigen ligase family protein [Paraliomyxa miuraensis]MCX4246804.1 O-antigen ligase family protein [Paraliomyxa miuraensis]
MSDDPDEDPELEPVEPVRRSGRRQQERRRSWSQALLMVAVGSPALMLGGVPPTAMLVFLVVLLALWQRMCTRSREPLLVPRPVLLGLAATLLTFVQWAPVPGIQQALAPQMHAAIEQALVGTGIEARPGLSPSPGDTGLECARLLGLTLLFVAAAQLSWRATATATALAGSAVALIGFAHEALGFQAIYGVYAPRDVDPSTLPSMMGTFVNPNHQSGLLLLGIFAAGGLAADQHRQGLDTRDPSKVDRYGDRFLAAMAALTVQVPALVLSLSRGAIVALLLVAPVATWLGLRRQRSERHSQRRRSRHMSPLRVVVVVGLLGLFLLVAQHGAWRELGTLLDLADPDADLDTKLRIAHESLALVGQSPWVGIGRGAFIDAFGAIDSTPTHVLHTHLESAPLAMVVEWGPWLGGAMVLGTAGWWVHAMVAHRRRHDGAARQLVLLGLLAAALQNAADFGFEFLGVAAPAVALAGALSPKPAWRWAPGRARWIGSVGLLAALGLATWSAPHSFTRRPAIDAAILAGEVDPRTEMPWRPLDGRLHGLWARRAAQRGQWEEARTRAEVSVARRPGNVDPWFILAAARAELGAPPEQVDRTMATGLAQLHDPLDEALVDHLLERYPSPEELAALCPGRAEPWMLLVDGLMPRAPRHADALAASYHELHPEDPAPLLVRHRLAMEAHDPGLALHHARLWRALAPEQSAAHLAVAGALRAFEPARLAEVEQALEHALREAPLPDDRARGEIEEEMLRTLIDLGDDASLARARTLVPVLLRRPAERETRRRRELMARRVPPPSSPPDPIERSPVFESD